VTIGSFLWLLEDGLQGSSDLLVVLSLDGFPVGTSLDDLNFECSLLAFLDNQKGSLSEFVEVLSETECQSTSVFQFD